MSARARTLADVGGLVLSGAVAPQLDAVDRNVAGPARAVEAADRRPNEIVEYDVFGDSLVSGLGVPPHLTWGAGISFHLSVTEGPGVEHRFHNHAIDGQAIVTPSALAVDARRSTLVDHVREFVASPPRPTPMAERQFVFTPSVNELILSDQGTSGEDRVSKAVDGVRAAVALLQAAGVPSNEIIVLPMPPIGVDFAADHDEGTDVDQPLAGMIATLNRRLGDTLALDGYAPLDPESDGLADVSAFDGWQGPPGTERPDGLHLDDHGHALIAIAIEPLFGTQT